ncbi:alpha/beta hydrolase [Rhodococcus spelaei]|uniref:Alpha/beta hydrolase n=1 Tax=Rhodococcus spelaei TaxID=2546320 RepID=A0A541B8M4_9NOCA|nr:alpha/beta hydrolase [Rhodococcus spelaei]TQF68682.1 alpha/beta hydrolase [Rhodococcus spelaei]
MHEFEFTTPRSHVRRPAQDIRWRDVRVDSTQVSYGVGGHGRPVVFLHGWGLAPGAYQAALRSLAGRGVRVYAPAMPGFGGTPELPVGQRNLAGYAQWVGKFIDAIGIRGPVTVAGHSFGGGVAARTAHDLPDHVDALVLVNSVGGAQWSPDGVARPIRERPLWEWLWHLQADAVSSGRFAQVVGAIAGDALPNVLRDPMAVWRTAHVARKADLRTELAELADRGIPVTLLWGTSDAVIPQVSFESMREALGDPRVVTVAGNHCWLIGDPETFGDAMTRALEPRRDVVPA